MIRSFAVGLGIECGLDALLAHVLAASGLGDFGPKLDHSVRKAHDRTVDAETACRQPSLKKAKKRLQQGATALTQYTHRLNSQRAKKRLDATLRQTFIDEAAPILSDLNTAGSGPMPGRCNAHVTRR